MLRHAVSTLGLALSVCSPALLFAAEAQTPMRVYRIGWLSSGFPSPTLAGTNRGTFIQALNDLGYVEGRNLVVDVRYADDKVERLPVVAAELVALKPDAILATTTQATSAAQQATRTIPIVFAQVSDPVGSGFVASLGHPGGNITGMTDFGIDLATKYVQLVHAVAPEATRIGVLMSDHPLHPAQLKLTRNAAAGIGITVLPTMDRSLGELEQGFASLIREKAGALIVLGASPMGGQAERIAELAAKARLPAVYPDRYYVVKGGLFSYGPNYPHMYKRAAAYVDRILRGGKPGDLPVEQPTIFELVINNKSAKALGITIPQSLRVTAEIIE
jgi:putative ABC transport system substrate-binding protein